MRVTFSMMAIRHSRARIEKRGYILGFVIGVLLSLFSGCVSQNARIARYIDAHPNLDSRIKHSLAARALSTGMNKEQCRLLLAQPDRISILGNRKITVRDEAHEIALRRADWVCVGHSFARNVYNIIERSREEFVGSVPSDLSGADVWEYVRLETSKKKWHAETISPKPWDSGPSKLGLALTRRPASPNAIRLQLIFRNDKLIRINEDKGMILGDKFLDVRMPHFGL